MIGTKEQTNQSHKLQQSKQATEQKQANKLQKYLQAKKQIAKMYTNKKIRNQTG